MSMFPSGVIALNGHVLEDEDPEVGVNYWCANCGGKLPKRAVRNGTWTSEIGEWCPEYLYHLKEGEVDGSAK